MRCEGEFGLGFKGSSVFFSLRVGVIPESSGWPLLFLKRGNSKSDNSLTIKASDRAEKQEDNRKDNKALR